MNDRVTRLHVFFVYVVFGAAVDFFWVVPCIWDGRRIIWPELTLFPFGTTSLALCVYMKQVQCILNGIWRDRQTQQQPRILYAHFRVFVVSHGAL